MSDQLPWERVYEPGSQPAKARAGMVVDLERCIGCHACSVACKTEHDVPLGDFRTRVRYLEPPTGNQLRFLPLLCMQCADAPCLDACPTEAIARHDDGSVHIDRNRCCGNKACVAACPYQAIYIDPEGLADKCDFCRHRTEVGLDPACVTACPTEAIRYGDLDDPADPVRAYIERRGGSAPFKPEAETAPSVVYIGLEDWMVDAAKSGVQLSPDDDEIVYETR